MPSSNSANPYEARRKKINPYNKTQQALQTGYSQQGDSVEPTPVPYHDQNRPGHVENSNPVRRGLDPSIYDRQTQVPVSLGTQETMLFTSVFPFHLVPRPTSANVIQRQPKRQYIFGYLRFECHKSRRNNRFRFRTTYC